MKKLKLVLHIGVHRTATSSLQSYLKVNFAPLMHQGILYPYGIKRHYALATSVFSRKITAKDLAEDLTKRAEDKPHPIDTILLSDEDMCMRDDFSAWAALKEYFDVHVVYALRRQDRWLESWYLQNVKWQWDPILSHAKFEEFLEQTALFHWIDYDGYVSMLEDTFGRDHVRIFAFDKPQMPEGPLAKFCDVTGIDTSEMISTPAQNQSLSPLVSEFARCMPLDQAPGKFRRKLEEALFAVEAEMFEGQPRRSDLMMDHATRTKVMEGYAAGNTRLAQRYFGRDDLFLEPMPAPDGPVATRTLPDNSYDLMERFVEPFVRDLIRQFEDEKAAAEGGKPRKGRAGAKGGGGPRGVAPQPMTQSSKS